VEQLFLERLNDARADPAAYGASIGVDLSGVAASQPLAFDPRLIQSARDHSQDMNVNNYFGHTGSDGSDPGQRMSAAGFPWSSWAESIAAGFSTPESALAGLIQDNGVPDLGHRRQLLSIDSFYQPFQEVGVGIIQNGSGAYHNYYTIDGGYTSDQRPFLTGVVYDDSNGNGKYDIGEGLGGVTITVAGVGSVTTWDSGGYSFQLSPGTYTVTASGGGLSTPETFTVTIGSQNYRLNFTQPTADLNWTGGGLSSLPSTADTQTPFTIQRSYNIDGAAVGSNFTISYYASTDTTVGNADDILIGQETITAAADKTVGTHTGTSPALRIGRPGYQYIIAVLDSGNNVAETDETNNTIVSSQTVNVTGSTDLIIDDLQAGFSETGSGWKVWSGGGYNGEQSYHEAGTGTNTAVYQVTSLPTADYTVQATWVPGSAEASNESYKIYDGSTLLTTVTVNYRVAPTGPTINGSVFQTLAKVHITSGTLQVVIDDGGDGQVVADAIHIASGTTSALPQIVYYGTSGFSTTGSDWQSWTGGGYNGQVRYHEAGTGAETATYQFSSLATGDYTVQATWVPGSAEASNELYRIYDGSTLLANVTVDYTVSPAGTTIYNGSVFQNLATVHITSGTLKVVIDDSGDGQVAADALAVALV
jgi:hypothetical protein